MAASNFQQSPSCPYHMAADGQTHRQTSAQRPAPPLPTGLASWSASSFTVCGRPQISTAARQHSHNPDGRHRPTAKQTTAKTSAKRANQCMSDSSPPPQKRGGLVGRSYQGVGVPHGVWGPDQPNHLVSAVHAQDTQEKKEKRKEKMAKPDSRAINRGSARHQQQRRRRRRGALSCLTRALSLGRGRPRRCAHVRVQRGGRCRLPLCRYLPHTGLV